MLSNFPRLFPSPKFIPLVFASSLFAGPAFAGVYLNVENRAAFTGKEYDEAATDLHIGFKQNLGNSANIYVQGGPTFFTKEDVDTTHEYSAKVGLEYDITKKLSVYGEVHAITEEEEVTEDINLTTKAGVTFNF